MACSPRPARLAVLVAGAVALTACGGHTLASRRAAPGAASRAQVLRAGDNPIDAQRALAHVARLTDAEMQGRMTASAGEEQANAYIQGEFEKLGLPVVRQTFRSRAFEGDAQNIIALMPGAERAGRVVIVGAHKDHLGVRGGRTYHGANDNAGGVAGVLEIARAIVDRNVNHGDRPRANILFMTFSGEELGLIGSTYYTKHPIMPTLDGGSRPIDLKDIVGMVNLDCIAVGNTDTIGTDAVEDGVGTRDALFTLAAGRGMKPVFKPFQIPHTHGHPGEALPPWASSDHASFRRAGVRSICYYAEPVMSKYLHSPNDTIPSRDAIKKAPADRFNPENLARIAAVGYDTVRTWAE
ncbi:MAG: M28 family peptidase [Candidatus Sericytochromatia bacterium]|nr:M28 family peptidase [Candidatus Sericytochromatia bacterium]